MCSGAGRLLPCVSLRFQPCRSSAALYMLLLADLVMDTSFTWELLVLPLRTASPQTPALRLALPFLHELLLAGTWVLAKVGSGL